jgi:hypothetical protein
MLSHVKMKRSKWSIVAPCRSSSLRAACPLRATVVFDFADSARPKLLAVLWRLERRFLELKEACSVSKVG